MEPEPTVTGSDGADVLGRRIGAGRSVIRNLFRPIDSLPWIVPYLLGLIVVLATGSRRQRIGDLVAGTRVVPA